MDYIYPLGLGTHCRLLTVVGCINPDTLGTANLATYLVTGQNRLIFQVFQKAGDGFDLDNTVVPEPGFYGVLALGLSGLCFAIRRKRSA